MQQYKAQLRQALADHGWEVVEAVASEEWWAEEFWKVQSRRNLWGYEIILTFLIDPMLVAPYKHQRLVSSVAATEGFPRDWQRADAQDIAELCMMKGRFDENLKTFVEALDLHRNQREAAREQQP